MRWFGALALRVCHGAADHDVRRLRALKEREKALVIFSPVLGIDIEGHRMTGADGVEPNTTLKTGAGAASKFALHFMLGDKLSRADRHVQEAVDLPSADIRMHGRESRPLGRDAEGFRHGVDRRLYHRMVYRLRHALAHEEHVHATTAQRIDVIVRALDGICEVRPQRLDVLHHTISSKHSPPSGPHRFLELVTYDFPRARTRDLGNQLHAVRDLVSR